ncbi:MAG: ribosome biogenesis factor YjgA [Pseudomonadota bacterium]|nr:ribosome biogenesis factor YjgA [Pseudomonadota bacterium]
MAHEDDDIEYELVSKTEMKREMHRFQSLGETLCDLPPAKWGSLPISDVLMAALEESRRIKKHEARRRHFQYIGKLMRAEDIDAVQEAVDMLDPSSEAFGRKTGQLEQWRTKLIQSDDALNEFLDIYYDTDRQQLRNLVRNARKEMQSEPPKPGNAYKKLFQLIKEIDANS